MKKVLTLLLLLCAVCMGAKADDAFRNHRYDTFKVTPINENSIVFVGNSITNMHPWVEAFGNDPRVVNRGNSGGTSAEILANVRSYCAGHPAKIFLMIGINDKPNGSNQASIVSNIENTIKAIQAESPATQIYVQSILPSGWFSNPTDIGNCNAAIQTMLTGYPAVTYIDVYSQLLGKLDTDNTGVYSFDKLHTTAAGYAIWTDYIKSYVGLTPVYPSEDETKACQLNGGNSGSWGARATYFSMLPIASDDVLFFGDEMVHGAEWQELLGNVHVKNRGTSWDYEKDRGWMSYTKNDVKATFTPVTGVTKQQPAQVILYTGTGEVNGTGDMSTIVDYYKGIVADIRGYAPTAKISLVSLMPTKTYSNSRVKDFNQQIEAYAATQTNVEYINIYSTLATADVPKAEYFPVDNYLYGDGYVAVANVLAGHIDGCSPVTPNQATAYRKLVKGTNADEDFFEEGWYQVQIGEGTGYNNYHQKYKGKYLYANPHVLSGYTWVIGLTDEATKPESFVYISGEHDKWKMQFKRGASDSYYAAANCLTSASGDNLSFIPNGEKTEWKIWGNNKNRWMGWDLNGPSVGSSSNSATAHDNNYFVFKKVKTVTPEVGKSYRVAVRYSNGSLHYVKGTSFSTTAGEADVYEVVNSGNADYPYAFVNGEGKYLTNRGAQTKSAGNGATCFEAGSMLDSYTNVTQPLYKRVGGIYLTAKERDADAKQLGNIIVTESNDTYANSNAPFMNGTYSSCIVLEEVPTFKVTYTFNLDGKKIGEWTVNEEEGATPTVASLLPAYAKIVGGLPAAVVEHAYTLETAHQGLPFELGEKHHYYINEWGISNRHYLLYANGSNAAVKETKQNQANVDPSAIADNKKLEHMWVVGGDWFNGFTFQNTLGYYIAAPKTNPANGDATVATLTESPLCHFDPFVQASTGVYSYRPHGGSNCLAHTSDASMNLSFYNAYSGDNLKATTYYFLDANADYVRLTTPVVLNNPNPTGTSGLDGKSVATFSSLLFDVQLPAGVVAYTAEVSGNAVTFNELGNVVPAGTGVLLYAANAASINDHATLYTGIVPAVGSNALLPTDGTEIPVGSYILANRNSHVAFYLIDPDKRTVAKNKAYLSVPAGANLQGFRFDFEDILTGMSATEANGQSADGKAYDLQGRQVQPTKSGLYIVGGKKVVR